VYATIIDMNLRSLQPDGSTPNEYDEWWYLTHPEPDVPTFTNDCDEVVQDSTFNDLEFDEI
jgi:hypothetical protein